MANFCALFKRKNLSENFVQNIKVASWLKGKKYNGHRVMAMRRGGITDFAWVPTHVIPPLPIAITQGGFTLNFFLNRALATHTPILGRVAQYAWE